MYVYIHVYMYIYECVICEKKIKRRKKGDEGTSEKSEELEGKSQCTIRKGDYLLL